MSDPRAAPEFSRSVRLDTIGAAERDITVEANADERRRLAGRFRLVAVDRLDGAFSVRSEAAGVRVRGRVIAAVVQACSISGQPLAATVDEPIDLLFAPQPADGGDEVELGDDTIDVIFHDGAAIDLGETAAETMALALDPFPRGPDAEAALAAAGVVREGEVTGGAFAALAGLLKKDQ